MSTMAQKDSVEMASVTLSCGYDESLCLPRTRYIQKARFSTRGRQSDRSIRIVDKVLEEEATELTSIFDQAVVEKVISVLIY